MELDEGEATKQEPAGTGTEIESPAANRFDPNTLDDEVGVLVRKSQSKPSRSLAPPPATKTSRTNAKTQPLGPPKRKNSRLNAFLEATRIRPTKSESEVGLSESVRARFGKAKAVAKDAIAPLADKVAKPDLNDGPAPQPSPKPAADPAADPARPDGIDQKETASNQEPSDAFKHSAEPKAVSTPVAARERLEPSAPQPQPVQELRRRTPAPAAKPDKAGQAKAPFEPGDSSPQPFTRRQTPPQRRRRQQSRYKRHAQSTLGLSWWYHHFQAPAWIGRTLWVGAFVCAWIALSRCLDPTISDPQLSQVPYYALLGWLLCAGLALNQRIPRRFRWTGLVLGAANSVALALSWSFRLDQL